VEGKKGGGGGSDIHSFFLSFHLPRKKGGREGVRNYQKEGKVSIYFSLLYLVEK